MSFFHQNFGLIGKEDVDREMKSSTNLLSLGLRTSLSRSAALRLPLISYNGRRNYGVESSAVLQMPKQDGSQLPSIASSTPDASFEVLGSPFSLLSVKLSPSQMLFTRRGTLVALSGNPENAVSSLSIISPLVRAIGGIPFLYQQISSTSPLTAVIGTNNASSSFTTVHLDGRVDWVVAQRSALLAWTGLNLIIRPKLTYHMSIAHWGNTQITGRGLISLVGKGQVYQINLMANEDYVVHPKHILAYSVNGSAPQPYRFKSSSLRFQIPSVSSLFPESRFFREMRNTTAWKFMLSATHLLRTWARRSIWGDRLFLRFQGPATILVQSRASKITDSLTSREVNEIADSPAGAPLSNTALSSQDQPGSKAEPAIKPKPLLEKPTVARTATVSPDGKVQIK